MYSEIENDKIVQVQTIVKLTYYYYIIRIEGGVREVLQYGEF